ncbi:hypothetical protein H0H81_009578 [Sphagnurus paluster]|uniref:MIF4G domain-containing protein n=1 Tax=Sphagnurus paluster TaxID=117069 RepID=A0A9P7K3Z9_9AGAR|nr:hypothetical protein H0H81_009578 [Sphagnurus paluster]
MNQEPGSLVSEIRRLCNVLYAIQLSTEKKDNRRKQQMDRFDFISDQIIAVVNKSEGEKDIRTLMVASRFVYEMATDDATWSEKYAHLCKKMIDRISPQVQRDTIKDAEGNPVPGGQLFRRYLLNRSQDDFERRWIAKEATATAAASKALEDQTGDDEVVVCSDTQKAKRQGLIKFLGELFKLQVLPVRLMHECVTMLLVNIENPKDPKEEDIESLCELLSNIGTILDTPKALARMDLYFSRMKVLAKSSNVNARMQLMLQAVEEKAAADSEKGTHQCQISMPGGDSGRRSDGGDYSQVVPDRWAFVRETGPSRPPSKDGDVTTFGKINKSSTVAFGPSSAFAGKKNHNRDSLSPINLKSSMPDMPKQGAEPATDVRVAPRPRPQWKRIVLLPRSKPIGHEASATKSESDNYVDDEEAATDMTEEQANKKIAENLKNFLAVRNLDEAEVYFTGLPVVHHFRLVNKFTSCAVGAKEADYRLLADFFARAVEKGLCSSAAFEEGLTPIAEVIDDPKAISIYARIVKSTQLAEEQTKRLASKSLDGDQLLILLSSTLF